MSESSSSSYTIVAAATNLHQIRVKAFRVLKHGKARGEKA